MAKSSYLSLTYIILHFSIFIYIYLFIVCVHVYECEVPLWRSEDSFWMLVLSFHHVDSVGGKLREVGLAAGAFPHEPALPHMIFTY